MTKEPARWRRWWRPDRGRRESEAWFRRSYAHWHQGREPDLCRPRLFSERVVVRILRERDPFLRLCCDKLESKAWIDARLGAGFTPRTLAVVDNPHRFADHDLPPHWILKANHGSGWMRWIQPADQPLSPDQIAEAQGWLERDYADVNHEWGYAGLPRRLIAEERLSYRGECCPELSVFCFAGVTPLIRLHQAAAIQDGSPQTWPRECFVDGRGRLLPIERPRRHHDPALRDVWADRLQDFLALARSLTAQQTFLRIDGYLSDPGIQVGELTPYPYAGLGFELQLCWDAWLGSFWK